MSSRSSRFRSRTAAFLALVLLLVNAGCVSPPAEADPQVTIRFSWWGNAEEAKTTQRAIDAFQQEHPHISVIGEPADFTTYFDRLATQVAADQAPDVMTLGGPYLREYGGRGALLDVAAVKDILDIDALGGSTLSNGRINNSQYGVPTGVNTFGVVIDTELLQAAGLEEPDDNAWTWDDFQTIAVQLARLVPQGSYAVTNPTRPETLDLYARQRGESLYTSDGRVGISRKTLIDWWSMALDLRDAGASPPISATSELVGRSDPEQSLLGRGLAGIQFDWSNLLDAMARSSGHRLKMLRAPGERTARQPGMWLQAAQLYSVSAKSPHRREAAKFVDFMINNEAAAKIVLLDRGIPTNPVVLSAITPLLTSDQAAQAKFVELMFLRAGPALEIGPTGSDQTINILQRIGGDVLSNRMTPGAGADEFLKQVKAALRP